MESVKVHLLEDNDFERKYRKASFYKRLSQGLIERAQELISWFPEYTALNWHFEAFYSNQSTGLHNDRNYFEHLGEICEAGMLVPLESGGSHATVFYDLFIDQKVNWNGVGFSTVDGQNVDCDATSLGTGREIEWSQNKIIFFDSRQVHEARPFTAESASYKISLNGLGYSQCRAVREGLRP